MREKISTINSWLNRPFPYPETQAPKVWISVAFGFFIFLFLAFFQPFGIEAISRYKILFLSGFGFITFISMMINFFVVPVFFPAFFNYDEWCIKNHLVFLLGNVLLISIFNWLYDSQMGQNISKSHSPFQFLVYTIGVGTIPMIMVTMYWERRLLKKHGLIAKNVSDQLEKQKGDVKSEEPICLVAETMKESFQLPQNRLICISSEGNYSKIYYQEQGRVEEKLMRMSLKSVEEHLVNFDKIVRCHRFFIVNLQQIASISGNARSFKLHMEDLGFSIPVSRSFPKAIIEQLKASQH
ncbi:LytTR family transcriptional regulator DNA-binding domain-containing protein [bacterium]|nr:LytTR family transcriptional regulator DNA-binding domain-containing protein [bacterium]